MVMNRIFSSMNSVFRCRRARFVTTDLVLIRDELSVLVLSGGASPARTSREVHLMDLEVPVWVEEADQVFPGTGNSRTAEGLAAKENGQLFPRNKKSG